MERLRSVSWNDFSKASFDGEARMKQETLLIVSMVLSMKSTSLAFESAKFKA